MSLILELSLSDDSHSPPHTDDTEMGDFFSDNGDGPGFESNYYPNASDDAPTPPEIDDTDTEDYDTDMTESFADNGDGFAQRGFVEDKEDYQSHTLSNRHSFIHPDSTIRSNTHPDGITHSYSALPQNGTMPPLPTYPPAIATNLRNLRLPSLTPASIHPLLQLSIPFRSPHPIHSTIVAQKF